MILAEATHWPLVLVGALPDSEDTHQPRMTTEEGCVWRGGDLRLAVVIAGAAIVASGTAQDDRHAPSTRALKRKTDVVP